METLARKIADFILADAPTEGEFDALARALFRRQWEGIGPYRRLCEGLGVGADDVRTWRDVPAVPAQAFKAFDLSCVSPDKTVAVFHSSGTTGPQTSRHFLDADGLALYEVSLGQGFHAAIPERPSELWALMSPPQNAPHSSLSHMLGALGAQRFFWDDNGGLGEALARLSGPITLFGTAFAFVSLFDSSERAWRLPTGSVVLETGGFKGRTREVPREELYRLFGTRLGVPETRCYSEYGMSEMASQFYGRGLDPVKRGPHWVRTRAIDPLTGEDAAPGTVGVLRHYDLANFNSVLALQTQDLGTLVDGGFVLHGRAADAEVRGCSLTVEDLWSR